jgi:hypothetical protein
MSNAHAENDKRRVIVTARKSHDCYERTKRDQALWVAVVGQSKRVKLLEFDSMPLLPTSRGIPVLGSRRSIPALLGAAAFATARVPGQKGGSDVMALDTWDEVDTDPTVSQHPHWGQYHCPANFAVDVAGLISEAWDDATAAPNLYRAARELMLYEITPYLRAGLKDPSLRKKPAPGDYFDIGDTVATHTGPW